MQRVQKNANAYGRVDTRYLFVTSPASVKVTLETSAGTVGSAASGDTTTKELLLSQTDENKEMYLQEIYS